MEKAIICLEWALFVLVFSMSTVGLIAEIQGRRNKLTMVAWRLGAFAAGFLLSGLLRTV